MQGSDFTQAFGEQLMPPQKHWLKAHWNMIPTPSAITKVIIMAKVMNAVTTMAMVMSAVTTMAMKAAAVITASKAL